MRIFLSLTLLSASSFASNQFMVLSGGGSPSGNHLSQYLQTKTLAEDFLQRFGVSRVDVYFAAGNREGQKATLADVHGIKVDGKIELHQMQPGFIRENNPATKSELINYFQQGERLSDLSQGDTFFMLVSDHGMPYVVDQSQGFTNNCINLWDHEPDAQPDFSKACLARKELQQLLANQLQGKRTVFGMSQCFSGGFHMMSVQERAGYPSANPNVCGFTAVLEDSVASGCTANVDGPSYKGYERFLTQRITGRDVVSGNALAHGASRTLKEAHLAAALEDFTLDLPTSTSDYYLLQWAKLLESPNFKPRVRVDQLQVQQLYNRALSGALNKSDLASAAGVLANEGSARVAHVEQMATNIGTYDSQLKNLDSLSLQEVQALRARFQNELGFAQREMAAAMKSYQSLVSQRIIPAWSQAVAEGSVSLPSKNALEYETETLQDFEAVYLRRPGLKEQIENMVVDFLAMHTLSQPALASDVSFYSASRESMRLEWALRDEELRADAESLERIEGQKKLAEEKMHRAQERLGLIRRVFVMRQQLAALVAIGAMKDTAAIQDLQGLANCESSEY